MACSLAHIVMASVGSRFGPYEILSSLGSGGMGEVYRARDPRLRREVALKILPNHRSKDEEAHARMLREARVVASLSHPNILDIFDIGEEDGQLYLVTELVEGETLRDLLGRGRLEWQHALEITRGVASGLAYAHLKSIVHRDIKPDNVMLTRENGVKILDFGVATFALPADAPTMAGPAFTALTQIGATAGTVAYMAPEQL